MIFFDTLTSKDLPIDFSQAIVEYQIMALSCDKDPGMRAPAPFEAQAPVVVPEIILEQGKPVSLREPRLVDKVGSIDWVTFAEKERRKAAFAAKETRLKNGFAAYRDAGGRLSEGLHRAIIARVERLQRRPDERERIKIHKPTISQAEGFVYRHNNPLGPGGSLPPEQQIALSQEQIDAYCLLREDRVKIPKKDRRKGADPARFFDVQLIGEIQKMPLLKSQGEQFQALPAAA